MWIQVVVCAVFAGHAALLLAQRAALQARLRRTERDTALLAQERQNERTGRVRAEIAVRELQLKVGQAGGASGGAGHPPDSPADLSRTPFPLRPIGVLRSCFSRRNGTPRQPLLVPAARARLTLRADLSPEFLHGLRQYSHCWVLYIFHENTDLQRLWQDGSSGVRAKIRVPRLNSERLGVFATRAPHRPCPIGLSVAEIVGVEGATLTLGGADIVDGAPVLDIKPYVPFCDAVPSATAPAWVAPVAEDEPLAVGSVRLLPAADAELRRCWELRGRESLFPSYPALRQLALQVLSRDIRSVTQRIKVPARQQQDSWLPALQSPAAAAAAAAAADAHGGEASEGKWHVVLDGIDIAYDVDERGVSIMSAAMAHHHLKT